MQKERIAFRMDDIFASSKQFEVYGREDMPVFSNLLFMKYLPGFRKRLPYREISVNEWKNIFDILKISQARLTIGITAAWVEKKSTLVPFFKKFPEEAEVLKLAMREGLIEIANHGYTHCVVGRHLPRPFSSNRMYHREFWDWVSQDVQEEHIRVSQELLEGYFGCKVVTFIPPGNVWTQDTEKIAIDHGLKFLSTNKPGTLMRYAGGDSVVAFHDLDIRANGLNWLESLIEKHKDKKIVTVRELAGFIE